MGLLGAHMSVAGGLHLAITRGEELNCEAIQIFPTSNRTWKITPLADADITLFRATAKASKKVKSIIAHNSYLLNLSTDNSEMRKKSVQFFIEVMERCEALGIEGLVTHPGSHLGAGVEVGIKRTQESLNEVLSACKGFQTKIVIENTAGQGGCVGCTFEEIAGIQNGVKEPERIFYCFDTQHAFAAGYDLRTAEKYQSVFSDWDRLLSTKRIVAFHLNDAMKEMGCRVDRHQNIGKGFLGKETFRCLVNDERFKNVPMCLETDPGEDLENYRSELKLLRGLVGKLGKNFSTARRVNQSL